MTYTGGGSYLKLGVTLLNLSAKVTILLRGLKSKRGAGHGPPGLPIHNYNMYMYVHRYLMGMY